MIPDSLKAYPNTPKFKSSTFKPQDYFKFQFGRRRGIRYCSPACMSAVEHGDYVVHGGDHQCHGFLWHEQSGSTPITGLTGLYSSLWVSEEAQLPIAEVYWNFILNPDISPFRTILQDNKGRRAQIIHDDNGKPICLFCPVDKGTPSQVFVSLCMASRTPYETPDELRSFEFWVNNGFSLTQAYILSTYVWLRDGSFYKSYGLDRTVLNPWVHNVNPKMILAGTPNYDTRKKMQRKDPYTPVMSIWHDDSYNDLLRTASSTIETYTGILPKRFKRLYSSIKFKDDVIKNSQTLLQVVREVWK